MFVALVGVKFKLKPLFPSVAGWHFNLLSAIGKLFNALTAFSADKAS